MKIRDGTHIPDRSVLMIDTAFSKGDGAPVFRGSMKNLDLDLIKDIKPFKEPSPRPLAKFPRADYLYGSDLVDTPKTSGRGVVDQLELPKPLRSSNKLL